MSIRTQKSERARVRIRYYLTLNSVQNAVIIVARNKGSLSVFIVVRIVACGGFVASSSPENGNIETNHLSSKGRSNSSLLTLKHSFNLPISSA